MSDDTSPSTGELASPNTSEEGTDDAPRIIQAKVSKKDYERMLLEIRLRMPDVPRNLSSIQIDLFGNKSLGLEIKAK